MMAVLFNEPFNGAAGTLLTTTNSAFTFIQDAPAFNADAAFGTVAMRATHTASATAPLGELNHGTQTTAYYRWYTKLISTGTLYYMFQTLSGTTVRAALSVDGQGALRMRQGTTGLGVASTARLSTTAYTRIEYAITPTSVQLRMYQGVNLHGTTPTYDSGPIAWTSPGSWDRVRIGSVLTVVNVDVLHDEFAGDNATWVGPASAPVVVRSGSASTATTHTVTAAGVNPVQNIPNPGRGFFHYTETHAPGAPVTTYAPLTASNLNAQRAAGTTLVFRYIILDQFLSTDTISQAFRDQLAADFAAVRAAGMKLVLRFAYSNSGDMEPPYNADPAVARVVTHIQQLAPTLNAYADVIDVMQAGFIGMWGEWYYTDNFGDMGTLTAQNWADRKTVINTLLDNVDEKVFIQLRYVGLKRRLADEGMGAAKLARIGIHNDAFLAPFDDYGTYSTFTSYSADQNRAWLEEHNRTGNYPMGGESAVTNPPRSEYAGAKAELAAYRWTYLNPNYHQEVLASWGETGRAEVAAKLGYNLTIGAVTAATNGAETNIGFDVTNAGWSAPYRNHPTLIDFVNGTTTVTRSLTADTRTWGPGTVRVTGVVASPPAGTWSVHLRIVDSSASLQSNTAYNIRTLSPGTFDATTGRNPLGTTVTSSVVENRSGSATTVAAHTVTAAGSRIVRGTAGTTTVHAVTAAGSKRPSGTAVTTSTHTVKASGATVRRGSAAIATSHTIATTGNRLQSGVASTVTTHVVSATGARLSKGASVASTSHAVTATGMVPQPGINAGAARITTTHTVVATGAVIRLGAASVHTLHTITSTGRTQPQGVALTTTLTTTKAAGMMPGQRRDITVTATLGARTLAGTIGARATTALIGQSAWEGTL